MRHKLFRLGLFAVLLVAAIAAYFTLLHGGVTNRLEAGQSILSKVPTDQMPAVFEGLPHHSYESELLGKELKTKITFEIGQYPFYKSPLTIRANDLADLAHITRNPESYRRLVGEKKCGGFHPDFALEWLLGARKIDVSICFGCCEAKISDGNWVVRVDLDKNAHVRFKALLRPYRTNRPASTDWIPDC
ncbi:MAG: hypothetical protein ACJ8C4_14695 [Gemmataceae bacterium]